ncbi:golgin subfamily A member 6-like protein 7 [Corythoichthys intestinalis]|uniref:golgin subfamily A member 6-like protein 7 n=1 Tax=Corythoichthys intestinalis TaxID=161448 RepID=UPI0025A5CC6B|nr:golgin subfamily A member 6-like protein 7 [Corythoichthys intestinalis]
MKNIKLQSQIVSSKAESKKKNEIIAEQAEEIAYLKESLQLKQAELEQSRTKAKRQQDQITTLEQSLHEHQEELQQSGKKVQMQISQICTLQQTLNDKKEELKYNDQTFQRQEAQIIALQQTLQDRMSQLEQSEQKVEELDEKFQNYIDLAELDKSNVEIREEKMMEDLQACHARLRSMEELYKKKKTSFWSFFWTERKRLVRAENQDKDPNKMKENEKADRREFHTILKSQAEINLDETLDRKKNETVKPVRRVSFNC